MIRAAFLTLSLLMISACSQGVQTMTDRTLLPCGDKPNCVSTQDSKRRAQYRALHFDRASQYQCD